MGLYALGYKEAADALLYALTERKVSLDSVIYPWSFFHFKEIE